MGRIRLTGATSGYTELRAASTAGNNTITLPTTNGGEVVVSDSSGNVNIDSGTFYVDAVNNRVGVGTTSPRFAISVGSTGSGSTATPDTIDLGSTFSSTAGANPKLRLYWDGSLSFGFGVSNNQLDYIIGNNSSHVWHSNGSERARIDSSGRLLVGTSSARTTANITSQIQVEGTGFSNSSLSLTANSNDSDSAYFIFTKTRGTSVGSNTLVQSGDQLGYIGFGGADGVDTMQNGAGIAAYVDGTPGANDMPGRLVFSTTADGASSPTERMRISNNGTIFLRATSLTDGANIQGANAYVGWRFDVGSNSDTLADQNAALCSSVYTSTNTGRATSALLLMSRAGASVGVCPLIKGYGGAGSEPSTATLQFLVSHNGNVQNTNNSYGSLSDLRLKENIVDAESQWQDIKSLQVRKFNFKNDAAKTPLLGLVAQEVEPISPGLIEQVLQANGTPDPEVPKAIKYSVLYMKAVKALQEAMERIETLEAKVAALESA